MSSKIIPYNSAGSGVIVSTDYTNIFTHSLLTSCPLTSCELKNKYCGTTLAETNVAFEAAIYQITAKENVPAGYTLPICFECIITMIGKTPIVFKKEIEVIQNALDCSTSLISASFANPTTITFNSAGSGITIISSYLDIF